MGEMHVGGARRRRQRRASAGQARLSHPGLIGVLIGRAKYNASSGEQEPKTENAVQTRVANSIMVHRPRKSMAHVCPSRVGPLSFFK